MIKKRICPAPLARRHLFDADEDYYEIDYYRVGPDGVERLAAWISVIKSNTYSVHYIDHDFGAESFETFEEAEAEVITELRF